MHVHELRGVMEREGAGIGVLTTMQKPTKPMREEAAADICTSPWGAHPRLQLLTVAGLLDGRRIDSPPLSHGGVTFKKAPKAKADGAGTTPSSTPTRPRRLPRDAPAVVIPRAEMRPPAGCRRADPRARLVALPLPAAPRRVYGACGASARSRSRVLSGCTTSDAEAPS